MKILFMCVANSARSQLAEGLAKKIFPTDEIESAGSNPSIVNPYANKVLQEVGIDISKQYSKSVHDLSEHFVRELDFVITLCAEEVCPVIITQAKRLHWPLPDPATKEILTESQMLDRFRNTRDQIKEKLLTFQKEMER